MTQQHDESQGAAEFLADQAEMFCDRVDSTAIELTAFAFFDSELDFGGMPDGEKPSPYHPAVVWAMFRSDIEQLTGSAGRNYPDTFDLDELERAAVLISLGSADHVARELLAQDAANSWTDELVDVLCRLSTPDFPFRVEVEEERARRVLARFRDRDPMRQSGASMVSYLAELDLDDSADALVSGSMTTAWSAG